MLMRNINTKRILVPLGGNLYVNYYNIIMILGPKEIEKTTWFKTKKLVKTKEDLKDAKSYIYCKNDFIIATSIEITSLKNKISEITETYYK